MAATVSDTLSAEQKARLHEIADLMLQIYETLAEMQYICPAGIIRGPHNIPDEMQQLYKDLELDPSIIYLYSILPYIDGHAADAEGFFQRSHFFNHMKATDVRSGRDPWYRDPKAGWDDEDGLYMRSWYTPFSRVWERSPVLIYDAREHRIWIANYDTSTDPFLCPRWYGELGDQKDDASDWGGTDGYSNWSEDGDNQEDGEGEADSQSTTSTGSSEFWDDEEKMDDEELNSLREDPTADVNFDEGFEIVEEMSWNEQRAALQIKNENSLELIQSRDASHALRDINRWYRELKEVPDKYDGLGSGPTVEEKTRRTLYKKHGWPDNFHAQAFTVDLIRTNAAERAGRDASERDPTKIFTKCKKRLGWCETYRFNFTDPVEAAKSVDEEWIARFKLLHFDLGMARHEWDMKEAEEELAKESIENKRSDEELAALREYEILRDDLGVRRQRAAQWQDTINSHDATNENFRYWETLQDHGSRLMPFYEIALVEARADAQRISPDKVVRPGVISKIDSEKTSLTWTMEELRKVKEFLSSVPSNAFKARVEVTKGVERLENSVRSVQARIVELEESLQDDQYEDGVSI